MSAEASHDRRDPVCGMTGVLQRHDRWFCSEGCVREFERRAATAPAASHAHATAGAGLRRVLDPWVWVPATGLLLSAADLLAPGAAQVSAIYRGYLRMVGLPLLLGLVIGGLIDHFIPKEYIIRLMSGPRKRVILRATALGFLASACSHGCLALSLELYRKGASVPAVVSFLLASPWASLSLTLILLGLFKLKGLVIIGCALVVAVLTGLIFQQLDARGLIERNPGTLPIAEGFSIRRDLAARWRAREWSAARLRDDARGVVTGMIPLGRMVLGWVQLGLVVSALAGAFVPHAAFVRFLGPTLGGLVLTLGIAAVIEVCSEGTAPVAFELYRHTGALGNAFAFLMGGVITDYTELGAVWQNVGKRTVRWLLLVTLPLVVGIGWALNQW